LSAPTIKNPMPSFDFVIDLQKKINFFKYPNLLGSLEVSH
jgi:hypothetical protein